MNQITYACTFYYRSLLKKRCQLSTRPQLMLCTQENFLPNRSFCTFNYISWHFHVLSSFFRFLSLSLVHLLSVYYLQNHDWPAMTAITGEQRLNECTRYISTVTSIYLKAKTLYSNINCINTSSLLFIFYASLGFAKERKHFADWMIFANATYSF